MNYPGKMGSLAQQLDILQRQGIPPPSSLNGREIPDEQPLNSFEEWLINTWRSIGSSRQTGENGPLPISLQDIQTYIVLMDEDFRRIDIELIRAIDKEFIDEIGTQREINKD